MLKNILSPDFLNAILRASTPILFATLASGIAAKSGITNMALEGMLLFASLFGVIFSSLTHSFLGGLVDYDGDRRMHRTRAGFLHSAAEDG